MKEIKASDLRIGNYFNQFGYEHQVDCETFKDLENAPKDQLWCKPIPLTEDWLKRFGFDIYERSTDINFWKAATHKLNVEFTINNANGDWRFTPIWCNDYKPILYVHQLQNLYHALTGEELTINN